MARPEPANEEQIKLALDGLPLWKRDGKKITRDFATANFASAVGLVNSIAVLAEKSDHHPDILIFGWNKVRITLSTHDQGGLTELDFKLAGEIDGLSL